MTSLRPPFLILFLCTFLLAAALAAGCTSAPPVSTTPVPTVSSAPPQTVVTTAGTCQFTNCHGLDLSCGAGGPQVCTMEYKLGDRCRQYAHCRPGSDGSCTLVTDPGFASCKACVDQCSIRAAGDSIAAFNCEETC